MKSMALDSTLLNAFPDGFRVGSLLSHCSSSSAGNMEEIQGEETFPRWFPPNGSSCTSHVEGRGKGGMRPCPEAAYDWLGSPLLTLSPSNLSICHFPRCPFYQRSPLPPAQPGIVPGGSSSLNAAAGWNRNQRGSGEGVSLCHCVLDPSLCLP